MDPGHRGWPPPGGNSQHGNAEQNQSQPARPPPFGAGGQQSPPQQSQQHPTQNLPPPPQPAPFPHFNQQPPPSLAGIASLSQSSPRQPQPSAARPDGPGLPLPGFSHATGQPGVVERERERAREQEQIQIKEEEDRRREQQERQRFEQAPPHQGPPGPPMPLHQPVAVGPRTALGPNGVLNNPLPSAPQPQPQLPMGAPSGPANIFAGGAVQPAGPPQAPGGQPMQQGMLMPFAPAAQPQQTPQQQPQQQGQQGQAQGQGQGQQPILNDALSYLDQVKVQFAEQPDVYNRFLDIMKDFKSGAIDTPGVIGRVSSLFAGNPDLIQGFNTFLPPGYRIECGADNDPNSIRVTTPMGVSFHKMPPQRPLSQQGNAEPFGVRTNGTFTPQPGQQSAQMAFSPSGRPLGPTAQGQQAPHLSPIEAARQQEQQAMHQQQERGLGSLQNAVSAATGAGLRAGISPRGTPLPGQQDPNVGDPTVGMEKRGPVEFNHAISYVNKIKNRFSAHPDIYKQFLEILQTYQRESKPIQEVYSQVTRLFNGAPDLLEDFKQFLPESAAHAKEAERARLRAEESAMMSNVRGEAYQSPVMSRETQIGTPSHARGNLPPVGNFAPTPNYKDNKRKRGDRQGTAGSANEGVAGPSTGKAGGYGGQQGKRLKQAHPQAGSKANDQPPQSPTLIPPLPMPLPPTTTSAATGEELQLFDRAKKLIGNKNTMSEFLKLCNLFTQDLIDRNTLVFRMQSYLGGNPDLMKAFRDWIGFDERDYMVENKAREPMVPGGRISLSNCRGLGPSYRLLPKRERVKPCSGRDELCNSVLNDEWASHPTWASEDSGFIAHRKNVHEEGLHRIEEERHDYDLNIEACSRTIQLLEPFAAQLSRMSNREAQTFNLPEKLGGQSDTIYKRVIMKCYGREKGADVVNQLHEMPGMVLPVLLNRLKERLESWKMAQREWEKVWREQTQRMFWKSLDHQAALAKITDRRQFQTKALQSEMQVRYEEAKQEEMRNIGSMAGRAQLEQKIDDVDVVVDTTYLMLMHMDSQGNTTENPRLAPFVREFVPSFFHLDPTEFDAKLKSKYGGTPTNGGAINEPFSGAEDSTTEKRGRKSVKANFQRQMFDKKNRGGRVESGSVSRASTPDVASNAGDAEAADVEMAGTPAAEDSEGKIAASVESQSGRRWLEHPTEQNEIGGRNVDPNAPEKRTVFRLWANQSMFCFVRMFMILYERLLKLKQSEAACREAVANASKHKPAKELGIYDKEPSEFFDDTSASANYYAQMLKKFALVLDQDLDFVNDGIEECLRRFYLQEGYPLYPLEKIVAAMARYGMQVVSQEGGNKEKSWDILQAWYKHGRKEEVGAREMTDYRRAVEKMIGNGGEGYGVDWDDEKKLIRIFLWKKDDPYFSGEPHSARDLENAWRYYIASYTSIDDTDAVNRSQIERVLLLRNLHAMGADPKADGFPLSFNSATLASATEGSASADDHGDGTIAPSTENINASTEVVGNKLLNRFLASRNQETLTLRIAVNNYHPIFTPNTAEAFFMPSSAREGGEGEVKGAAETEGEREGIVREKFLLMNEGMKGLTREEVEGRNGGFGGLVGDDGEGAGVGGEGDKGAVGMGEEGGDVEMGV